MGGVDKFSHVNVMAPELTHQKSVSLVTRGFSRADFVWTRVNYGYDVICSQSSENSCLPRKQVTYKMAVVCFTQGTCVMEQSDNNM